MASLKNLTKTEKRVAILKDAIAQVKAEKYTVLASNGFVKGDIDYKIEEYLEAACTLNLDPKKIQIKDHLDNILESNTCEVCVKGALFLSSIRKFNNFSLQDAKHNGLDGEASYKIRELFGAKNADLMEEYFEHDSYSTDARDVGISNEYDVCEDDVKHLTSKDKWLYMYPDDTDRALAIFKNALKNNGTFKPEQLKFKLRK